MSCGENHQMGGWYRRNDRKTDVSALDLTHPLPPSVGALARWTAEPVKHIWLPASSFIPNGKGYPVLSKACQAFLKGMTKVGP